MSHTATTVPAADGYALAATWYGDPAPARVVLIAPATGVRRHLYDPFARFPSAPLSCVGHSFGGQGVRLAPNAARVSALVTVAAQSGYWRLWPRPARYKLALLWHAGVPLSTHLLGYCPGCRLGLGEDLPRGVALEWAGRCRRPDYLGDCRGHAALRAPMLSFSFADDPFAPRAAVEALHAHYGAREREHHHVTPAELGLRRLGHFGFFRGGAEPLWRETAEWLRRH